MPPRSRSRQSRAAGTPEPSRSPRATRARSSNDLSGLDPNPENKQDDEEYEEGDSTAKVDNDGDEELNDEAESASRNSRKRNRADEDEEAGAERPEAEGPEADIGDEDEDMDEGEEEDEEDEEEDADADSNVPKEIKQAPKRRGRKRTKFIETGEGFLDEDGNPISIKNDEVVIEDEDPKGCAKIDENGKLKGGRDFRMKAFKVMGQGDRLYMVSTEPARLVGFRDSYLLFKTHRSLFKKVCTHEEKMDLIDRHIIPNSYKGRSVNLVTARSIFREFGARMIRQGKKVIDDFWEQRAIDNGDISGDYADPNELSKNNIRLSNLLGDGPNVANVTTPITGAALVNFQSDPSWMHQIASQTREYNRLLVEQRSQIWKRGLKDVYTGLTLYPASGQPTKATVQKIGESEHLICDVRIVHPDIRRKATGLASVPKEIFDDLEDEDLKKHILEQQAFERSI